MGNDAKILTGIGILTVIIVIAAAFTIGNKPAPIQEEQVQKVLGESQVKLLVRPDTHMIKGPKDAVTIVEFGDMECPACGVSHEIVKRVLKDYKGKINYAFREFPLSIHKNGYMAAQAAEAAGGQGKFWEMHDKLYENQSDWSDKNVPLDVFSIYAKEIGINVDTFKKDVQSKKYDIRIKNDLSDGNQLKVDATPTFYIGNKVFSGVLRYEDFKREIDSKLKK